MIFAITDEQWGPILVAVAGLITAIAAAIRGEVNKRAHEKALDEKQDKPQW